MALANSTEFSDQVKMHNDLFIEMLEVYCHSILYLRGVYRAEVFRKRKVYNTAVYISISPMLNDYLTGCCKTAKELKGKNVLKRAELIIFEKQIDENSQELQNELEKYVFVVTDTPQISFDLTAHLLNMEEQLRRGLIDLEQSTKRLPKLDAPNCGFRIELGIDKTAYNEIVNSGNERSEVSVQT